VDAHNEGISPLRSELSWLLFLYKYFQQTADLTLVTNEVLARRVSRNGGKPLVLPDKLPRLPAIRKLELQGRQNLAVVTTFAPDEPFQEMFEAARLFPDDVVFHFTGDHRTARIDLGRLAPNIVLAGYLPDRDYWDLIASVDLVIDLTSLDDCLVCGAYEAVAAGTPLVLSDNEAARKYFSGGVVLTENSAGSIAKAVDFGLRRRDELRYEIGRLKEELLLSWSQAGSRLKSELQQMCK
jgi:glycosyltransferase involved in cell wall biosynthesis